MSEIDSILKGAPEYKPGAQSTSTAPPAAPPSEIDAALSDAPTTARGLKGWGQDIAATAVKGAIAVPEAVVGLADIPTGGRVGKFLENEGGAVGFRPKQAREAVNEWHSDATLEAQRKFQEADGIVDKAVTAVQNPSLIATAIGESLPSMGAGGVAARGLLTATRLGQLGAKGAALAGAAGEGLTMAGSQAEQIRQETPDGLLTPGQAGLAAATGAVGGAFGAVGGRIAQRLGIGDAETMLAQGQSGMARQFADEAAGAAVNPLQQQAVKSIPRHVIEGAIAEGLLEELPQSVAEQIFQNVALDKPWYDQVDSAIVLGTLSGGAMGAGAAGYHAAARPRAGAVGESDPAAALPAGNEPAAEAPARNPGLERVSQAFAEQLRMLQEQEQGEVLGPQSTPPDGAAALAEQRATAEAQRQADMEASRAVESPDDEIYQSTGAEVPRSVRMGINPAGGPLSAGAAMAVDTGVSDQMQQAAALAQAAEAAEKGGKAQKQEQPERAPQGADPETGEIPGPDAVANWSDAQLSASFRSAQGRDVRIKLAQELSRRKAARAAEHSPPVKGSTDGYQTQPASPPPPAGAAQAPAVAAAGAPAQGALSNAGTTTADPGAQGKTAAGAKAAPESADQRAQRIDAAGQTWTRLPTVQRQVVAEQLKGLKPVLQKNLAGAKWDNLNADLKRKIADLIAPAQEAAAAPARARAAPVAMARGTTFPPLDAPPAPAAAAASAPPKAAGTSARRARAAAAPVSAPAMVQAAAQEAATSLSNDLPEPTAAQKDAGNYKKGHVKVNGHDISIENPAGTRRRPEWPPLQNHYGYIKGSKGADKDHVDVFMTDRAEDAGLPVFVVDQVNRDGSFDEHKVVMGAADEAEARSTYLGNNEKGWTGLGGITRMTQAEFKDWVRDPARTVKPAAAPVTGDALPPVATGEAGPAPAKDAEPAQASAPALPVAESGSSAPPAPQALPAAAETVPQRMKRVKAEKAAAPAAPAAAGEASPAAKPKTVPEKMKDAKAKRESKAVREAREAEERRAAYFAPGNVVRGYGGGFDRVVSYQPADTDGRWSVTVREVQKDGNGAWADKAGAVDRTHGTEPSKMNYAAGPAARMKVDPAPAAAVAVEPLVPASAPALVLDAGTREDGLGAGRITDFGEKIGGARKDQATRAPKAIKPRSSDERPAWARRFEISQIAKSSRLGEEGRWVVRDARSLDAFKQPRRVGAETYATREDAEQAVPLLAVSQKHSPVPLRGDGAGYEIWREVSDRKRVKVVDQVFSTRDAALEYMAKNAQAIIETNTTFGEADLPRPPSEERVGVPRRSGDARDSDFMDVFGFRGVEFGNWNNQQERQQLLNDAYDGLLDLAEVMGVPPRAISLNGDLALAFGARGHGLSSARAHYEPAKAVINLTKMNGAGSLAHEWFHALDHYFGRQDGKAPAEWVVGKDGTRSLEINDAAESNMVSGGTRGERSAMRPQLREAFADVMRTIARKAEAYVEDTARADRFVASAREDVRRQLNSIRADLARDLDARYYKRFNKAASADQLAEFDSVAEKILAGELLDLRIETKGSARSIASGMRWTNDALNRISAVIKAVRGRQGFSAAQDGPLDRMGGLMRNYSARLKMLADAQQANEKSRMVPTDFVMSAKELDQGRGQDYWTRPHELAARAFQGYVEDKIAAGGGRSPFLNYGPEGVAIPTPWGFKRPFPAGAERVAINQALERLAATIQTRESDSGGVALFRRGAEDDLGAGMAADLLRIMGKGDGFSAAAQRQAVDTVRATVNPIVAAWQNAPEVVVAYDLDDPVIPQRVRDADLRQRTGGAHGAPEGFYFGGKAYLMASRLTTPADAARVLYHEVAGHHGLRGLFGPELDKILNQVATMRRADVDAKMAEYGMRGVDRISRIRAAEEVLAEMAEKNPQQSFVQRAVAAIRNFLRAHVPGFGSLRLRDADIIQAYILPARNWVERAAAERERGMGSAAMQYSLAQDEARSGFAAEVRASITAGLNNDERALRAQVPLGIETPAALEALGVVRKPVVTNRNLIAKMHFEHGVPRAELERLGELLSNPVMVFKSDTQPGRMVVVTSLVVRGNPVVVAVDPNGASNRAEVVYVPSAYPKDNADRTFTRWIRDGLLQFANKKESRHLATTARLQLPGVVQRAAGFRADYKTEADLPQTGDGPDVMFSRERIAALKESALDQITQTMSHPGQVSLWDKTIGTMRNLAERAPAFKPVFESAQRFIDDVSMLGNDAADMAPRLLPRVDSWRDLTKKPITAADNKAVARPLFEGTLMWARDIDGTPVLLDDLTAKYQNLPADQKAQLLLRGGRLDPKILTAWQGLPVGMYEANVNTSFNSRVLKAGVVWSQRELETMFGLDANQVSLYQEGRAAIDRSIDMTARADMLRSLGDEYAGMRDAVLAQETMDDAVELLTRTLMDDARDRPEWSERLMELNNSVVKARERAQQLMDEGYAPLSRFGRYTVDVVDAAGDRQYFGMFETKGDSNRMKAEMEKQFPGATVTQGTMSQDAFKLFAGVTPESLEMFGSMLGLDGTGDDPKDKAFQAYLQLAKNNHSALKRLIHRKGIAGYSEDVGRVLAGFVYSNARLGAGGLNAGTMESAINAIPKEQGELKDLAMGLRDYIANPQEEGQAVRGMLFAQYLGGSLASAFVNMTQPFAVTLPWLTQFGGMKRAGAQMARALKDMSRKGFEYEPDLAAAMQSAEEDGVVSPQEIHQLMAQARGTGSLRTGDGTKAGDARAAAANNWERVKVAWGQPFALAEQFNRRSTFIAAYRIAKEQGMAEPSNFARKAVLETQFLYSKANKMRFARGAVGGTLMTFKTYSVSYLELMHRMWTQGGPEGKRAVGWAVAMLLLMSGAGGLPFMEDAEDLIDGAGQLMGYNLSAKQWRKQALRDVVGKEVADFLEQGLSGLPGAPVDVSGRLGMGNLLPGTGLFLSKQNRERDLLEVAGPAGDVVARGFTAVRKGLTGDVGGAALELSPTAVRNAVKGIDMAATGIYKDKKGYKVIDTTLAEAGSKFLGFQPKSVAEVQEANSFMQRTKSFYTQTSSEIKAQWADALYRKDDTALAAARERLADWNRNNPEQPIVVKMPDVWKRVREMDKDRTQRIADTAPKALRQQMREAGQAPA